MRSHFRRLLLSAFICATAFPSLATATETEQLCNDLKEKVSPSDSQLYLLRGKLNAADHTWEMASNVGLGGTPVPVPKKSTGRATLIYFIDRGENQSGALNVRIRNQASGSGRQTETVALEREAVADACQGFRRTRSRIEKSVGINTYIDYHNFSGSDSTIRSFHISYPTVDGRCVRTDETTQRRAEFQFNDITFFPRLDTAVKSTLATAQTAIETLSPFNAPQVTRAKRERLLVSFFGIAPALASIGMGAPDPSKSRSSITEPFYSVLRSKIVRYPSSDRQCVVFHISPEPQDFRTIISITDLETKNANSILFFQHWDLNWISEFKK